MGAASDRLREYRLLSEAVQPLTVIPNLKTGVENLVRIAPTDKAKARVLSYFGIYNHRAGDHTSAFDQFRRSFDLSGDVETLRNALIVSRKCKPGNAVGALHKAADDLFKTMPDSIEKAGLCDVLCHNAGELKDMQEAASYGAESLRLKDKFAKRPVKLKDRNKPDFNFYDASRNVISFSLFGNRQRYTSMAIENAKAVQYIYPGWSCRFYVDKEVPNTVLDQLVQLGSQVRVMSVPHKPDVLSGMFWRFLIASDPDVDFFLVRDADSLINVREKVAVDEWLQSDKSFHVIRDFYTHSELMLAGLWGGVAGRLADIRQESEQYQDSCKTNVLGVGNYDQLFLRNHVWPAIKHDLMQHDSVFMREGTKDFPKVGLMQPVRHVGQDMNVFRK